MAPCPLVPGCCCRRTRCSRVTSVPYPLSVPVTPAQRTQVHVTELKPFSSVADPFSCSSLRYVSVSTEIHFSILPSGSMLPRCPAVDKVLCPLSALITALGRCPLTRIPICCALRIQMNLLLSGALSLLPHAAHKMDVCVV